MASARDIIECLDKMLTPHVTVPVHLALESCPECGVQFALPLPLLYAKRDEQGDISCPNGHAYAFAETMRERVAALLDDNLESTEVRGLKRQLGQEKHAREQLEGALADKSRRRRTTKKPNGGTKR